MIMSMSNLICVTNRTLCHGNFLAQIEKIAACHPAAILLREKDLTPDAYKELAMEVIKICNQHQTPCILHGFADVAFQLHADAIHLPLPLLRQLTGEQRKRFVKLGSSCHSVEDALEAQALGCTYIIAGHIFETDCKKGLPGRGLTFLKEVCQSVTLPVYAIGGITSENIRQVLAAGASGVCMMHSLMECEDTAILHNLINPA